MSDALQSFVRSVAVTLLFIMCVAQGRSQTVQNDTTISLVTFYPGTEIFELEGHTAIRITTPDNDVAVHYGVFNFNEPNFVYRFVKGETDYMVGLAPWSLFEYDYRKQNRRIVSQRLNLTGDEKARLIELLKVNLRPENRTYRYNYVLDNCATRPLKMIEAAVGDTILLPQPPEMQQINTFRNFMRHYHANYPWYQFGIDLALGNGIDREITAREKSFAPVILVNQAAAAHIGTDTGRPLVDLTEVLFDATPDAAIEGPTPWYATPLFICWLVSLALTAYSLYLVYKRNSYPRIAATVMFFINGLAGLLITFLVFVSVHEATSPNVNLLWLNPLCFIPAVTILIKRAQKVTTWYMWFNTAMLTIVVLCWIFGYQSPNAAFVPPVLCNAVMSVLYIIWKRKIEKA